jgi:hypothetical protein
MNYILAICDFILGVMNLCMYAQNGSLRNLAFGIILIAFGVSFLGEER